MPNHYGYFFSQTFPTLEDYLDQDVTKLIKTLGSSRLRKRMICGATIDMIMKRSEREEQVNTGDN